jgi:hypothetical protein
MAGAQTVDVASELLRGVHTESAPVPAALEGARARGVLWQAAPARFQLEAPGTARYLVKDGASITIDPVPGSCDQDVVRFLHMTPLAALCFQRGLLAFHAACCAPAVSISPSAGSGSAGGAILIAGDSGSGKSTLLAALLQRGWTMLADELTVVQVDAHGQPFALPTTPEIRLWPDAVTRLGLADEKTDGAPPQTYRFPETQLADAAIPLGAIYWLSIYHGSEIEVAELQAGERFAALGKLTYNSHIADALLDRVLYLRSGSAIARSVPMRRLRRPRGRWSVAELADVF